MSLSAGVRRAATIVLARDSHEGPEVLLTVRPKKLSFMGGAVVFPGGAVAEADLDERWSKASTRTRRNAADVLEDSDEAAALGAFVCCLREAFEEVGFLVGSGDIQALRRSHAGDPSTFLERCLEHGVVLDTHRLEPAGRSVTPAPSPVRFDAHFFVSRAPAGWAPDRNPAEVDRCFWATPAGALRDLAEGHAVMAPPTIQMLQRLAPFGDVEAILRTARAGALKRWERILSARVAPQVGVVVAPNPGIMTGPGTNTYVVGGGRTCVIDPAVDDADYLIAVLGMAEDVGSILITHRHPDHVGGVDALASATGAPVRAFGTAPAGGTAVLPMVDEEVIEAGSAHLTALHTPGHAPDHLCFLLDAENGLFAGDNVLGEGTAVIAPPEGDMRAYLASLQRMRSLAVGRIYPGHFRLLEDGPATLDAYLAHRAQRRSAILEATGAPATADDIVARVYSDTPGYLHRVAALQVLAHLELLEDEGEVVRTARSGHDYWRRSGSPGAQATGEWDT
jgi:glyoxylase-like metal-dependent hydrolase (beta-lactamase superfamily II)/8-oxo-dGTP pyrophosphatase MutT (NUDIX family)